MKVNKNIQIKKNCVFCQIAENPKLAKIEYQDEEIVAFWDIKPSAPIHLLIIPKKHITNVCQLTTADQELVGKMIIVAKMLAEKKKVDKSGFRLVINNGPWAGQIVYHLHLHLLAGKESNS